MKLKKRFQFMAILVMLLLVSMIAILAWVAPANSGTASTLEVMNVIMNAVLLIVLLGLAVSLIKYGCAWLDAHTKAIKSTMKNQTVSNAFNQMEQAVSAAVAQTAQQEADPLKAEAAVSGGKLTDEQKTELLVLARDRAVELVSQDTLNIVMQNVSDFDAWIQAHIEKDVRAGKQG